MGTFLLTSLIASVVLTILINLIPRLFPAATEKAEQAVHEKMSQALQDQREGNGPRVKVFFPWKSMIVISIVLTILVNLIGLFLTG